MTEPAAAGGEISAGPLRRAWDEGAADWIAWARNPAADRWFWTHNLPALLELVPDGASEALEIGAGEGRVARALAGRGLRVVALEQSPALAAAARAAGGGVEVVEGDAADLPFADARFDVVVASMVLLNLDDLEGAVAEAARVLRPGGALVASTRHPVRSMEPAGGYHRDVTFTEVRERDGTRMAFTDRHRPLADLFAALEAAGLRVEALREPAEARFLHLRAVTSG